MGNYLSRQSARDFFARFSLYQRYQRHRNLQVRAKWAADFIQKLLYLVDSSRHKSSILKIYESLREEINDSHFIFVLTVFIDERMQQQNHAWAADSFQQRYYHENNGGERVIAVLKSELLKQNHYYEGYALMLILGLKGNASDDEILVLKDSLTFPEADETLLCFSWKWGAGLFLSFYLLLLSIHWKQVSDVQSQMIQAQEVLRVQKNH